MALNLGGLFFTLDADTRGLVNAQRRIEAFATQVRTAFRGVGKGTVDSSFANSLGRQEAAMVRFVQQINRLQQSVARVDLTPKGAREAQVALERLGMAFDNYTRKMTSGALDSNMFARRQAAMGQAMNAAQASIRGIIKDSTAAERPALNLSRALMGLGSASLFVQGHFGGLSTRMFGLTGLVRELGPIIAITTASIVGVGAAVDALGVHAVKAGMDLQILQVQFQAITGSTAIAGHDIDYVRQVAEKSGLQFEGLADSYAKFSAAATNSGLSVSQTEKVFREISQTAGVLHLSTDKVQLSFLALEQMLSKGTVYTEELRRQLGDQIPGAMAVAARAMGTTQAKLMQMLKDGVIPATEFVPKFAEALLAAFHIDPTKNVESLQASLMRLHNQWTYLGQDIAQQTNLLGILQHIVDGTANAMAKLGANFSTIAGVIGAVTGAVLGLAAAWAFLNGVALVGNIIAAATGFIQLTQEIGLAASAMRAFGIVSALVSGTTVVGLIAVIAGAVLGFKAFKGAMQQTAEQVSSSLTSIDDYITMSEKQGSQIRSVTQDLMRQTVAIQNNAAAMAAQANAALLSAQSSGPNLADMANAVKGNFTDLFFGSGSLKDVTSADKERQKRIQGLQSQVKQWTQAWRSAQAAIQGLQDVSKLPEQTGDPVERLTKGKGTHDIDGIINKVKDLRQEAITAEAALNELFNAASSGAASPGEAAKRIEDMGKALEVVNNLKPKQAAAAAATLGVPLSQLTATLADYITRARQAKEISDDFLKVWTQADESRIKIQGLTQQLAQLRLVGDDPHQMRMLTNLQDAENTLRDLNDKVATGGQVGKQATQALNTLQNVLARMGYGGMDAAHGLAAMNTQIQDMEEGVKLIQDMSVKFRDLEDEINNTVFELQGMKGGFDFLSGMKGNLANFAFGPDLDQAFQQAIERGRQVLDLRRQMAALPDIFSADDINNVSNAFLDLLRSLDQYKMDLADAQRIAQRNKDAINSWVTDGLNGVKDFLEGVKSLGAALTDLSKSFLDTAWQTFIVGPAQDLMNKLGRGLTSKATKGVDTDVAKNTASKLTDLADAAGLAGDATKQDYLKSILSVITGQTTQQQATISASAGLVTVATAANQAAAALASLALSGSGGGFGGGLGGLLSSIFGGGGAGVASSLTFSGGSLADVFATLPAVPGLATGGNMNAGTLYRINEPGVMGEYFIPRVNGYMSNGAPSGGGGPPIMIDASVGYIDARGATPDAVAALDAKMQEREKRLKAQLPYEIDARVLDSSRRNRFS